jgi:arylsulfatase
VADVREHVPASSSVLPREKYFDRYDASQMPEPAYREGELGNKPVYQREDHRGAYAGADISFARLDPAARRQITGAYYAMIEHVDFEFGRMLQALDESGQTENTVVIFMSDYGEMLGDHGIYLKGPYSTIPPFAFR